MILEMVCIFILVFCFIGSILRILDYRIPLGLGIILIIGASISVAVTKGEEVSHYAITLAYFTILSGVIGCIITHFRPRAGK